MRGGHAIQHEGPESSPGYESGVGRFTASHRCGPATEGRGPGRVIGGNLRPGRRMFGDLPPGYGMHLLSRCGERRARAAFGLVHRPRAFIGGRAWMTLVAVAVAVINSRRERLHRAEVLLRPWQSMPRRADARPTVALDVWLADHYLVLGYDLHGAVVQDVHDSAAHHLARRAA